MTYYNCNEGYVILLADRFTKSVIILAQKNNIILLTKNDLALKLKDKVEFIKV